MSEGLNIETSFMNTKLKAKSGNQKIGTPLVGQAFIKVTLPGLSVAVTTLFPSRIPRESHSNFSLYNSDTENRCDNEKYKKT